MREEDVVVVKHIAVNFLIIFGMIAAIAVPLPILFYITDTGVLGVWERLLLVEI